MADNGWRETTVGVLCDEGILHTQTGPFGSQLHSYDYVPSGVPVVPTEGIGRRRLLTDGIPEVAEETAARLSRHRLKAGDILFARRGVQATGLSAIVTQRQEGWLCGTGAILLRVKSKVVDPEFLSFLLSAEESVLWLKQHAVGAVMPNLNEGVIRQIPLTLPPLAEQKTIAAVLGALDDKIELNRRMNATLESMARALFQSWFVDFDPVRAKLDGKGFNSPRRNGEAKGFESPDLHLFPDSFQDSELGPIPKGWNATTLGNACESGGGNIQTGPFGTQLHASDYVAEGIPSIMPIDIRDNRIDIGSIARIREEDAERLSMYRVRTGDVVYSRRGDVERRSLIRQREDGWLCGTGCLRVRFGPKGMNPYFGASYLGTAESRAWVVRHAVGATMPNLNTAILGALPMIVPPLELQARFADIVGAWDERGTVALEQSRTLATLRDTLLPKLLSGDIGLGEITSPL